MPKKFNSWLPLYLNWGCVERSFTVDQQWLLILRHTGLTLHPTAVTALCRFWTGVGYESSAKVNCDSQRDRYTRARLQAAVSSVTLKTGQQITTEYLQLTRGSILKRNKAEQKVYIGLHFGWHASISLNSGTRVETGFWWCMKTISRLQQKKTNRIVWCKKYFSACKIQS